MKLSATRLRGELLHVLDRVLQTGEPVEIERPGGTVVIRRVRKSRTATKTKSAARGNPKLVVGDPDELIHFDWSRYSTPRL